MCDFYTEGYNTKLSGFQAQCTSEACAASKAPPAGSGAGATACDPVAIGCPTARAALEAYLAAVPCTCRWLVLARQAATALYYPTVLAQVILPDRPRAPKPYTLHPNP